MTSILSIIEIVIVILRNFHSCTVHIGPVTFVPCILILSKSFIYHLTHNRVALKEY